MEEQPYGPEWEKEMMKMTKKELVNFIRDMAQRRKRQIEALQQRISDQKQE